MMTHSRGVRRPWLVAVLVASVALLPATLAWGGKGGRGGRGPRQMAPRRPNAMRSQGPRMARGSNVARPNLAGNANAQARAGNLGGTNAAATGANARGPLAATSAIGTPTTGTLGPATPRSTMYAYGSGSSARQMHSYGYGHGYRNRSGGRGSNRSQGNNRALVSRLRSVHTSLAKLDHDYRGHRVKAMHSISGAVRMLSHRSTNANGTANANGLGNVRNTALARNGANGNRNGNGNNNRNGNANANGGARMSQAQSDQRMSQALRTTQGIHMQMANQGSNNSSVYAARRHVAKATSELHTALAAR